MTQNLMPAHLVGRRFEVLQDSRKTIDQHGLPIGGYIRISTQKDTQKSSIENQKKLISQWAEVNGFILTRFYVDIKTGKFLHHRNEIQEMMEDLRKDSIKGVVTKEIARTSRDIMDILELKRDIARNGGFLISIKENYDSRTDDDEFLLVIYGALAQKEQKTTAGRVKITQMIKAKEGKTNVAHPAFGYMLSEDKQRLVPNPETVPVYRFIVERFMEGWGQLKIAKYLNKNGIPSKRGKKWCTNSIKVILSNPVYLGVTIYNATTLIRDAQGKPRRVVRPQEEWIIRYGTHEPLITAEEFEKIQMIMRDRREKDCKEWSCSRKYLGSGILYCAVCKGKIYGTRFEHKSNGKKTGKYFYRYVCRGLNGACDSSTRYWKVENIDFNIRELIKELFSDKKKLYRYVQEQFKMFAQDFSGELRERAALKEKLVQIEKAVKKQQLAFEEDAITLAEYKARMEELRREKQSILERINRLDRQLTQHDSLLDRLNSVFARVAQKIDKIHELPLEEVSGYVDAIFEKIFIAQDGSITDVVFHV